MRSVSKYTHTHTVNFCWSATTVSAKSSYPPSSKLSNPANFPTTDCGELTNIHCSLYSCTREYMFARVFDANMRGGGAVSPAAEYVIPLFQFLYPMFPLCL